MRLTERRRRATRRAGSSSALLDWPLQPTLTEAAAQPSAVSSQSLIRGAHSASAVTQASVSPSLEPRVLSLHSWNLVGLPTA